MDTNNHSLDEARAAKTKAAAALSHLPVVGLGITRCGTGYGVKVNLSEAVPHGTVPADVDGVPLRAEVVGTIKKQ